MFSVLIINASTISLLPADIDVWQQSCLVSVSDRQSLRRFLHLDPAAAHALVDVIAFLTAFTLSSGEAAECAAVVEEIRRLPGTCCMRDGRKWNRVPCVTLCQTAHMPGKEVLQAMGVPQIAYRSTDYWGKGGPGKFHDVDLALAGVVGVYRRQVLSTYRDVGILVDYDHGRYRVRRGLRQAAALNESEYYYSPGDRRKLASYVTVHRDICGIEYEAQLLEDMINDPATRERDLQRFFESHPAFLMDSLRGLPISHQPTLNTPKGWTPDFVLPLPVAIDDSPKTVNIVELKGSDVPLLSGKLHRGFSHHVMAAINQVRDYDSILREREERNRARIVNTFGYLPKDFRKAVVIGRTPRERPNQEILQKRASQQPDVRIVTYDEILQSQTTQLTIPTMTDWAG